MNPTSKPAIDQSAQVRTAVEKWLTENDAKLRQYASALARRDNGGYFEENDFYQNMYMKIWLQAQVPGNFIEQKSGYILRVAWNEGLDMLRRQRKYDTVVNSGFITSIDGDDDFDPLDNFPGDESQTPERKMIKGEDDDLLNRAIASLPEESRKVCSHLYAGRTPKEIAAMEELPLKKIYRQIYKIRVVFSGFGLQTAC